MYAISENFHEKLKAARCAAGLSQLQVSKRLHLSVSVISGYENSMKMPSLPSFLALCRLYKCSADSLLGLSKQDYIDVSGITERQKELINGLVQELR